MSAPPYREHPLNRAVRASVMTAFLMAGLAHGTHAFSAQSAVLDAVQQKHFDIPAGPLGQTLSRFALEEKIALSFEPALTNGRQSPGVSGNLTARQAATRLLAGSGLELVARGDGSYSLRETPVASNSAEVTSLAAVRVAGHVDLSGTTEGTGSYAATRTNTATKLALSPRETPQTVTVVTRQQMDDFAMTSVDDALEATSGVFVYNRSNNGSAYYSRGFSLQSQYDGVPNPIGISEFNRVPPIDNAFLDRVEVLQGPSGLLSGAGDPGGTVNLIRKRPTDTFQAQAEVQLGSWDQKRLVGDVSGPLTESGHVRGRLVAVVDNNDSFIDYVYNNRRGVYGILEADLTPTTTLTTSFQYQRDKGRMHSGVPLGPDGSDLGWRRSIYFGNPDAQSIKEYKLYTLSLEQRLPADWLMKATYSRNETDVNNTKGSWAWGNLDVAMGDGLSLNQYKSLRRNFNSDSFDVYASGPVTLLGRQHELAFGFNGSTMKDDSLNTGNVPTPINVYHFDPHALPEPVLGTPSPSEGKTQQYGAFAVGRFNLSDSLKLIAGARVSSYEQRNLLTDETNQKENGVVSPYAGLVYDINKQLSAYASYSDIFKPQSQKSADGDTLEPVVGANYEIGLKGELFDGALNAAVALFRLEQTNLARLDDSVPPDPGNACGGSCYIAADKIVSQGADVSVNGEILSGWNVAAGYTYVSSKYASGTNKGEHYMRSLPRHSLRLASSYKLPDTRWTIGGNLRVFSELDNMGSDYGIHRGGMALVGLTAKYQISSQAEVTLVVDNLFDRRYYATVDSLYYSPFGEPRRISANLRYRF
ncbi:TonB-dependent siderophore receptor [Allopusillimonas ginsengisoli]|uniref:TonB-dependent siderophore receptor n=1 Tax=Allopusillimonas ginsengisoli TaxID=453575 RepID=UPI00101EE189|nr:TonB-dependent receptor [Allopusillimonas ginsengisoli]TEA78859.1 TonB-dependent siderophore receptor [Allopusillimonas ginsengisoli]